MTKMKELDIFKRNYICFVLLFCFTIFILSNSKAQWLAGYSFRKSVEINESYVPGTVDLIDFPLLVNITDPDLAHTSSGGHVEHISGYDINFTSSNGTTTLDFEIEKYISTIGEFVAWVRIPSLSVTSNTIIYLYYGNSGISIESFTTSTWNTKIPQERGI